MTKLVAIQKQYNQALKKFEEILARAKNDVVRDSAIKRFEFCFDLAWKLVKELLADKKGILCASPKDCFRQAYKAGLIEYDEIWLMMTNWRNEAVHTYSEKFADSLYKKLPQTLKCFRDLQESFK